MYKPNKQMQDAARRAIVWNASQSPSGKWGTPTGRRRATQLANGDAVSLDIVERMFSFLSRHRSNYEQYVGADVKGKGYYAYLGWGGPSALGWARRILNQENAREN